MSYSDKAIFFAIVGGGAGGTATGITTFDTTDNAGTKGGKSVAQD